MIKKLKEMPTRKLYKLFVYFVLIMFAISIIVPITWVFFASLKTPQEFFMNPWKMPSSFYFKNFVDAFIGANMGQYFLNSVIVTALALIILLVVALPAAYVLARFEFKFKNLILV